MGGIAWIDEVIEIDNTDWVDKDMGEVPWDRNKVTRKKGRVIERKGV